MPEQKENYLRQPEDLREITGLKLEKTGELGEGLKEDSLKVEKELEGHKRVVESAENERLLEDIGKTIEETNAIESLIEAQQQETQKKKIRKKGIKSFLRNVAILMVASFGLSALYEGVTNIRSEREGQTIERNIGFDLKESAEQYGFKLELQVDNGDGKYIIHIGQMHCSLDGDSQMDVDEISEYQKNIEKVIIEMQNKKNINKKIFSEGIMFNDEEDFIGGIKNIRESYAGKVGDVGGYLNLLIMVEKDFDEDDQSFGSSIMNYIRLQNIEKMENYFKENPPLDFETEEKIKKDKEYVKTNPEVLDMIGDYETLKEASKILNRIRSKGLIEKIKNYTYYRIGADRKLFIDNKIELKGSEEKEAHVKVGQLSKIGVKDFGSIVKWRALNKGREDATVKIISSNTGGDEYQSTILVYGDAHDFSQSVENYNKNNPGNKVGLIKLYRK